MDILGDALEWNIIFYCRRIGLTSTTQMIFNIFISLLYNKEFAVLAPPITKMDITSCNSERYVLRCGI
jgi:hypothetical protein